MNSRRSVVVGAGVTGTSAALTLAAQGHSVTLIDENPLSAACLAADTPYFFGPRPVPGINHRGLMLERVLEANPALQQAWEAGVEVLLGTSVWGSFRAGENYRHLDRPCLGLADAERSWTLEYDRLILATGARDLVLSFPGWELQGVLGAQAAHALLARYGAFSGRRIVILGSGPLALATAALALHHGLEIAGIVEVADSVQGDAEQAAELGKLGVPFFTAHVPLRATGQDEVRSLEIAALDRNGKPVAGRVRELTCDTVCLAIGLVPNVELPALSGCSLAYDGSSGGWVPRRDASLQSSVSGIYVAGDAGGILHDSAQAEAEGRRAALAAAGQSVPREVVTARRDIDEERRRWLAALVTCGGMEVLVCQCEEVSRRELIEVSPPRYLNALRAPGLASLDDLSVPNPNVLKRLTRAGMGHCQGRRCREQVALLLAEAAGVDPASVPLATYRPPIRPIPLRVLQSEADEPGQPWAMWFHPVRR